MRPTKTRTRRRSLPALAALLIAGGCGGGDEAEPPPRPTIARATAEQLAATSDAIADALDAGDVCSAAGRADDLRAQVVAAINAKKIPPRFQEDVLGHAQALVNAVNCPPPPAQTTTQEESEDDGQRTTEKKKEKPKKHAEDTGTQTQAPTEPTPTVTLP